MSNHISESTIAKDTCPTLAARPNHRTGSYAPTDPGRPDPRPSVGFSFRPLSAVRQAKDWLAPKCQFSVHRRAGRKPLQGVTRIEARGRLGSRAGRQFDTTDVQLKKNKNCNNNQNRTCYDQSVRRCITLL